MKALILLTSMIIGVLLVQTSFADPAVSTEQNPYYNTPESTSGTQIGKTVSSPVGFHGVVPVDQRSGSAQVSVSTTAAVSGAGTWGYASAAQADGLVTLVNEIRAVLVEKGLMKGAQ